MTPTPLAPPVPSAIARVGAARREITPPVGIYNRMWGAAAHDTAAGVHRPITLTVCAFLPEHGGDPLLLVSLDWCVLADGEDLARLRDPLVELAGGDSARVVLACTHTHGVGIVTSGRTDLPGGHLIPAYLERAGRELADAAREAVESAVPCVITWAEGRCSLAAHRDLPDPDGSRYLCGYHPGVPADDTVLVGRITRARDGGLAATLVNYACHPTTLAWENRLLSPDYIGAMREVVEAATGGAPCLFLQGASGELGPAHAYVGDPEVADGHGRRLGYAALSALAGMLPPGERLAYRGCVESGAPLAVWRPERFPLPGSLTTRRIEVELALKELPTPEALRLELEHCADRALSERLRRKLALVRKLGRGPGYRSPVWLWRIGEAILVAQPNEAYSAFQLELRREFPRQAVLVANVANGSAGYLPPEELYGEDLYQVWQTPFDRGGLERLTREVAAALRLLLAAE